MSGIASALAWLALGVFPISGLAVSNPRIAEQEFGRGSILVEPVSLGKAIYVFTLKYIRVFDHDDNPQISAFGSDLLDFGLAQERRFSIQEAASIKRLVGGDDFPAARFLFAHGVIWNGGQITDDDLDDCIFNHGWALAEVPEHHHYRRNNLRLHAGEKHLSFAQFVAQPMHSNALKHEVRPLRVHESDSAAFRSLRRDRGGVGSLGVQLISANNINHPDKSYEYTEAGYDEHPFGPLGHIPLGLKVLLFTPLIPFGLWVTWRGLDYAARRHDLRSAALGAGVMLAGTAMAIFSFAWLVIS